MRFCREDMKLALCGVLITIGLLCAGCSAGEPTLAPPHAIIFHARWCKACPSEDTITRIILDNPNVCIMAVDVDNDPDNLTSRYFIRRVPTYIFCNGTECRATSNLSELKSWLEDCR